MANGNDTYDLNDSTLDYKVSVGDNDLRDIADVVSIHVRKQFFKIASAEVEVHYGSLLGNEFVDDQNEDLAIGNELEIHAGEENDMCLFKGVIVRKSVSMTDKKSILRLTAKNKAYKMTQNRYNHVFTDMKDSEIIEELIGKYGLGCDVDATSYKNEIATQYNCSDWDFINIKADANSLLVLADDDQIMVKKPKVGSPKVEINGYAIIDFDAQLDGRNAFSSYKAASWNYNSQEKQEVEQKNASDDFSQGSQQGKQLADKLENDTYNMNFNSSFVDSDIITEKLNATMMRNNLSRIIGKVRLYGVTAVVPGETVSFSGLGGSFNGDAFVTEVEFDFSQGAWNTLIGFGLEETPYYWMYDDVNAAPASELLPATHGLQIAKVVALEGDPSDDCRIKISLPCFDGNSTEVWARFATPNAGKERGVFFFPEVDDEVVIGFADQNPNNPIVLGALHSNKLASPQALSDDNNMKGFYLKSGIKLEFNEEDKIVSIETPGSNKLVLNDKDGKIEIVDSNGNQIVMDNQGINIKSAGKIVMEATSDMNLKGVNMTSEASASYKASGNGNAEVSSSGIMVVKGSLVQIN